VKSLGEPDPFRLRYRDALRAIVRTVVQELTPADDVDARIARLAQPLAAVEDRAQLQAVARQDLHNLNEGTFHRYRLRPSEYERWTARDVSPAPRTPGSRRPPRARRAR
jgi:hypothetical protein